MIKPTTDDRQELLDIEQAWVRAHLEMNIQTIRAILDDEYTQLKADGSLIGKHALLADYALGLRHWEIAKSEPIKVQIVGDIGLLFGKWWGKGKITANPSTTRHFSWLYIANGTTSGNCLQMQALFKEINDYGRLYFLPNHCW